MGPYRIGDRIIIDVDAPTKGTSRFVVESWRHRKNDRGIIVNVDGHGGCVVLCDGGELLGFSCGGLRRSEKSKKHPCIRKIIGLQPVRRLKEFKL